MVVAMTPDERAQLRRFLLRLHWVLSHPAATGQATMAWVHGMRYSGPVLDRSEIHALVGLPAELPKPEYPGTEFCAELVPGRPKTWILIHDDCPSASDPYVVRDKPVEANMRLRGTAEQVWDWIRAQTDGETYACNATGRMLMTEEEAEQKWYARYSEKIEGT